MAVEARGGDRDRGEVEGWDDGGDVRLDQQAAGAPAAAGIASAFERVEDGRLLRDEEAAADAVHAALVIGGRLVAAIARAGRCETWLGRKKACGAVEQKK